MQSDYVLLLNLFPDQLDRTGGLDYIQDSIARALQASPATTLIYNADDPHCEKIARMVENPRIPFGIDEALDALMALGFTLADATKALEGVDAKLPVEERIRQALKNR